MKLEARDTQTYKEVLEKLLDKIKEDLVEAYERTPYHISSKPYIYKALKNVENLKKIVKELDSFINKFKS